MTDTIDSFLARWTAAERSGNIDTLDGSSPTTSWESGRWASPCPSPNGWIGTARPSPTTAFDLDETQGCTYGDAAIVIARHTQRGTAFGHSIPESVRVTHVLVREGRNWHLASVQMSFIAGSAGAPPFPVPFFPPPGAKNDDPCRPFRSTSLGCVRLPGSA